MGADEEKKAAAEAAVGLVQDGMALGLGTGSTVQFALEAIARLVKQGHRLRGVPTSRRTETEANRLGIPLTTLDDEPWLDLTIDGADELDERLHLIKGGGGALLREKVVAAASKSMAVIADSKKLVRDLGSTFPVPVEVVPFARARVDRALRALGALPTLRSKDGATVATDNGGWILDATFPRIPDPAKMERDIKGIPGVMEVGIFARHATVAFVGTSDGVRRLERPS